MCAVSDSGSMESSQSSANRADTNSLHHHHGTARRRRHSSDRQHYLVSECNGAGDSTLPEYMMHDDDDGATEDAGSTMYETLSLSDSPAPCGLRGCKNGPAPFPDRMSYKVTKPGIVCLSYLSMLYYCIVVY